MKTTLSSPRSHSALSALALCLPPIIFFLIMCFGHRSTARPTLLILLGLVLVLGVIRFRAFKKRIYLPLIALTLLVTMGELSTFYAVSGKFALEEFLSIAVAFCAVILLLLFTDKEGSAPSRKIASILAWAAALASLFSIDLIATKLLSGTLHTFFSLFSSSFMVLTGVEVGIRMISIFGNANVFAGCAGIGVLLSLSLVLSAESKQDRRAHVCCLYINSVAFLLAFSMGATASIAAAFPVFLLLEHKDRRGDLFLLMVNTLVVAAAGVAVCSMTALDRWTGIQPIPLLCLVAGSILLCLLHEQVGCRLAHILTGKGKLLAAMAVTFLVLLVGFLLTAYNVTGPIQLAQGSSINRSAYPDPGNYTISAAGGEGVQVTILSQNIYESMMHTQTELYNGPLSDASFSVPEDSLVVYFQLHAKQDTVLEQVVYTGQSGQGSVPLGYPLLPNFIANRLQGLFANQNAIQRAVFFKDGIEIFKMQPIFGFGMGAFMSLAQSVQDFYYETRYVHNHYIQTLLETGLVGLFLFVSLLVLSAVCVLKARKQDSFHPLTPALGAALVFMSIHAGVEIVFSVYCYLPLAFGVFVLINLCCGHVLPRPNKRICTAFCLIWAVLMLIFSFFVTRNMTAQRITNQAKTFETFDRAATIDPFEWKDYALNYIFNSILEDSDSAIHQRGIYYAQRLDCGPSNIVYRHLTGYYLAIGQIEQAMRMAQIHANYTASNSEEWCELMNVLARFAQTDPVYLDGVAQLVKMMETWNEEHIGHIQLNEQAQAFVDWALAQ